MYIEITIDLRNYDNDNFDIRLSNFHSVKKVVDIVWQAKQLGGKPNEGHWVKVVNKQKVVPGNKRLIDAGITTGDRIEIL